LGLRPFHPNNNKGRMRYPNVIKEGREMEKKGN